MDTYNVKMDTLIKQVCKNGHIQCKIGHINKTGM